MIWIGIAIAIIFLGAIAMGVDEASNDGDV
jgi:hypothetical protein